jgi:hypothetical protein
MMEEIPNTLFMEWAAFMALEQEDEERAAKNGGGNRQKISM